MKKQKKILLFILFFCGLFILFSVIGEFNQKNKDNLSEKDLATLLELEKKYSYLNINPNKYKSVNEYLESQKTVLEKTGIDYKTQNFVVGIYDQNKNITGYAGIQADKDLSKLSKIDKNITIYQVAESIKNNGVFGGKNSNTQTQVIMDYERIHPQSEILKDFFSGKQNPYDFISDMKKNQDLSELSNDDKEIYAYLNDFIGDYKESNLARKETDNKKEKVTIDGFVKDGEGKPIVSTKVTLLNTNQTVLTDEKGYYKLVTSMFPLAHLRVSIEKTGYAGGNKVYYLNDTEYSIENHLIGLDFTMYKAKETFTFDSKSALEKTLGIYLVIDTKDGSKYFIPKEGLYYEDGTLFSLDKSKININTYEFDRTYNNENFLGNDSFNKSLGFLGNQMITFGMPYIQMYDKNGKQLYSLEDNPIVLQTKIKHLNEMYSEDLYGTLTKENVKNLYNYSIKSNGYPITYAYLKENNLLSWGVRWIFDSITGIWYDTGHRLIDDKGTVEVSFYQTKAIQKN